MNSLCDTQYSTIAELVFYIDPFLNLSRLVNELETVLERFNRHGGQLRWDCEDVATFDMPGTRIVLATSENPRPGIAASLTISVGPSDIPAITEKTLSHASLCSRLVERIQTRVCADTVFWHQSAELVHPYLLDALTASFPPPPELRVHPHTFFTTVSDDTIDDIMRRSFDLRPPQEPAADPVKEAASPQAVTVTPAASKAPRRVRAARVSPLPPFIASNDQPDLPRPRDTDLIRLRDALYPIDDPGAPVKSSTQMRLAVHTLNTTLIIVALPIGAAMLTYSLMRGDNMRATTAATVVTGLALAFSNGPFGQFVAMVG